MRKGGAVLLAGALVAMLGIVHVLLLPSSNEARLSYDAMRYLAGAESLLAEGRYLDIDGSPQQVWLPGTSLVYAGLSRLSGKPPLALTGFVDLTAYLLLVAACLVIARVSGMRWFVAAGLIAAVACNGVLLSMHNKLWSDPLALALLMGMLASLPALLDEHASPASKRTTMTLAWLFAAAAILVRYAMLPVIPLMMLAGLYARRWLFAALAPFAVVPAIIAMSATGASSGNRTFGARELPWDANGAALLQLADQVFPARILGIFAGVLFAALCVAVPLVAWRSQAGAARSMALAASLWVLGYGTFLPIAQAFADPSFPFTERILLPLYLGAMIATATACELLLRRRSRVLAVCVAVPLLLAGTRGMRYAVTQMGAAPPTLQPCIGRTTHTELLRRAAPPGPVVSNAQGPLWLAVRRPVGVPGDAGTPVWVDPADACPDTVETDAPAPEGAVVVRLPGR
jgi:hypothetical protein